MNPENQQSFEQDVDQSLSIGNSAKDVDSNIIQFPTERTRPADDEPDEPEAFPADAGNVPAEPEAAPGRRRGVAAALAVAAAAGFLMLPRGGDAPAPVEKPDFLEQARESAQTPYDPKKDILVIDGIKINPNDPELNTASEAVEADPVVSEFIAKYPEEEASIEASMMAVPSNESGEYVVVDRDVNGDKIPDAVVVSKE